MAAVWAALLALPAAWGIGLGLARLLDRHSNMLPAMTILGMLVVLVAVAVAPWSPAASRLRLMQGLAAFSLALMFVLA